MPRRTARCLSACALTAALACLAGAAPADAQQGAADGFAIFHSVAGGVLAHDRGLFTENEEDGVDINLEIQFAEPGWDWWREIGSPRPRIGGTVNAAGETGFGYAGLYWDWYVLDDVFLAGGLGAAVHDGDLDAPPSEKQLGSRALFHLAVEAGWRFADRHALSVYADHASNAGLADDNEGLETVGIRYHFFFGGPD